MIKGYLLKHYLAVLITAFCAQLVSAQSKSQVQWISFEQLEDSLKARPKKVFIDFFTEWCTYCRKMEKEVFTKPAVAAVLNNDYYAVKMDAESMDTIRFDGQLFINRNSTKRRKGIHDLALLLGQRDGRFAPPTMLVLDAEFTIKQRYFSYMHSQKLLKALE